MQLLRREAERQELLVSLHSKWYTKDFDLPRMQELPLRRRNLALPRLLRPHQVKLLSLAEEEVEGSSEKRKDRKERHRERKRERG